jgi:NTE family protein
VAGLAGRPALPHPDCGRVALLLPGGGALGSYQAGVYEALAEAGIHPNWIAGISIGAVNSALIAGNRPEDRVAKLRAFWEAVSEPLPGLTRLATMNLHGDWQHRVANVLSAWRVLLFGAPDFFVPRKVPPFLHPPGSAEALSWYEISALRGTLERLVDFDRINHHDISLSVGAVNVRTGNFLYFDNRTHRIGPAHIMASGALPPGFPAVEIEGELYWDGGLVSNTPLQWVLNSEEPMDTLAFQVDLWSAAGELPRDLLESEERQKEIRYSSRTRAAPDDFLRIQRLRQTIGRVMDELPPEMKEKPHVQELARAARERSYNIIHIIYRSKNWEGLSRDYEFSRRSMELHWRAGYNDTARTLRHKEVLERHPESNGCFTFDLARDGRY